MAKVYIVPEQIPNEVGVLQNVSWIAGRTDVKFDVWIGEDEEPTTLAAVYDEPGEGSISRFPCYAARDEEELATIAIIQVENEGSYGYQVGFVPDGEQGGPFVDGKIAAYYEASDDPEAPKPDNIDIHTASRNRVVEATRPAQVRSQLNWMDRLERIIIDNNLRVEGVDEQARSVEKYLDAIDGRRNLDPIIRISKNIDKTENDDQESAESDEHPTK